MRTKLLSDFIIQAALKEAARTIDQQRIIRLTANESMALMELMTTESTVNEASIAAMRHHKEIIDSL